MKLKVNLENLTEEERENLMALIEKSNKPKSKVWKPKEDEEYWYITDEGGINQALWSNYSCHINSYNIGICFKTKEEAKFMVEKLKVIAELKRFAEEHNEYEIDWNDTYERKYCLFYDYLIKDIGVRSTFCDKYNEVYFYSLDVAKKAIFAIGENRLKKYYFEVENHNCEVAKGA